MLCPNEKLAAGLKYRTTCTEEILYGKLNFLEE